MRLHNASEIMKLKEVRGFGVWNVVNPLWREVRVKFRGYEQIWNNAAPSCTFVAPYCNILRQLSLK